MAEKGSLLLDPTMLASVKDLSLVARTVVAGFKSGSNRSTARGSGMEFSQYRSYQPGDDLRRLDWKLFARSDRYYIQEAEVESNLKLQFILDGSASMNHEDSGISKIQYARMLAACLAYLGFLQGDQINLNILGEPVNSSSTESLTSFFSRLEFLNATGSLNQGAEAQYHSISRQRGIIVLITDFYEFENEITRLAETLSKNQELIAFHIMARNETELRYTSSYVQDLETSKKISWNENSRKQYKKVFALYMERLAERMKNLHVNYHLCLITEDLEASLRNFLILRNRFNKG